MYISDKWQDFELLDCSKGEKLERWGSYYLVRPDPQAIWETPREDERWNCRDARYRRSETGGGSWDKGGLPASWKIRYGELTFNVKPMNFKHTGLFPEQACNWDFAMDKIRSAGRPISVLNLFAYTGAASVACAKAGASVCHVDAAKGMVAWAKEMLQPRDFPMRPYAGLLTTAPSLWSVKSAEAENMMQSSWTRPPTAAVPAERYGSWSRICGPLFPCAQVFFPMTRCLSSSIPTPRDFPPPFFPMSPKAYLPKNSAATPTHRSLVCQ